MSLDQRGKIMAEYVWIDAVGGVRSKTRVCLFFSLLVPFLSLWRRGCSCDRAATVSGMPPLWAISQTIPRTRISGLQQRLNPCDKHYRNVARDEVLLQEQEMTPARQVGKKPGFQKMTQC